MQAMTIITTLPALLAGPGGLPIAPHAHETALLH